MKKIITAVMLLSSLGISAQETYQNAELMNNDLNGSARYVGMGGAMDALGADLSTIGTNPAGIGLFRKSAATVSFSLNGMKNGGNMNGDNKTMMSFDQAGFVITSRSYSGNFFNFAVNYSKSNNFNQILSVANQIEAGSQNAIAFEKQDNGTVSTSIDRNNYINVNNDCGTVTDYLYYNTLMPTIYADGDYVLDFNDADRFALERDRKGYIGQYDFNIAGSINHRVYLGLTVGIKDVHYKNSTIYTEDLLDADGFCGNVKLDDMREITGTGYNARAGIIFRPIEAQPFRIGLSIATPTWYDLTTSNYTTLYNNTKYNQDDGYRDCSVPEEYDYIIVTPWEFGLSCGTTIGRSVAIGAGVDFKDYASAKTRIKDGGDSYYAHDWVDNSHNDDAMNRHTDKALKSVTTFKIGAELKPIPELAFRVGYNYVSPMYQKDAVRDQTINSPGTYYSSTTDYTNWKSTNRLTFGVGFIMDNFTLDFAYQYSATSGDFKPFQDYGTPSTALSKTMPTEIHNDRHQLLCTMGLRF